MLYTFWILPLGARIRQSGPQYSLDGQGMRLDHYKYTQTATSATYYNHAFSQAVKDWKLAVGVLVLMVVDLVILITYTAIEGARGVVVVSTLNKENPSRSEEVGHHNF